MPKKKTRPIFTTDHLEALGACATSRRRFRKLFPGGLDLSDAKALRKRFKALRATPNRVSRLPDFEWLVGDLYHTMDGEKFLPPSVVNALEEVGNDGCEAWDRAYAALVPEGDSVCISTAQWRELDRISDDHTIREAMILRRWLVRNWSRFGRECAARAEARKADRRMDDYAGAGR